MLNLDPLTIALVLGLAAAIWYKKEAYKCGGCGR